jgi:6-phosphogluconolactonase
MLHLSNTLAHDVAQQAARHIHSAIAARGICHLGLSGGNTPKAYLPALWDVLGVIPSEQLKLYLVDERMAPAGHPEHNATMLASYLPLPLQGIDTQLPPQEAAQIYSNQLPHPLDLVLLGVGDDGHVASLFPDADGWDALTPAAVALYVPKLQSWRVSMSLGTLLSARQMMVVAQGASKAAVIARTQAPKSERALPMDWLAPSPSKITCQEITWFCDAAAGIHVYSPAKA